MVREHLMMLIPGSGLVESRRFLVSFFLLPPSFVMKSLSERDSSLEVLRAKLVESQEGIPQEVNDVREGREPVLAAPYKLGAKNCAFETVYQLF